MDKPNWAETTQKSSIQLNKERDYATQINFWDITPSEIPQSQKANTVMSFLT